MCACCGDIFTPSWQQEEQEDLPAETLHQLDGLSAPSATESPTDSHKHTEAFQSCAEQERSASEGREIEAPISGASVARISTNNEPRLLTQTQGNIMIILLLVGLGMPFWGKAKPVQKWEYRVVDIVATVPVEALALSGDALKLAYKTVDISPSTLDTMGEEGWELVTSFLEMETTHPNFGKGEYVTGLQPHIRPQGAILLFKRPKRS